MSIALLSAVPRFLVSVFAELLRAWAAQFRSLGIEDDDVVSSEWNFLGLPEGFVAMVGVLAVDADFIVIAGDSLLDGLPWWLNELEGVDFL
jgi:hypothetical protein